MHVSVRRYKTDSKSVSDVVRKIREEFIPIVSQIPGFVSYQVLDAGNGVIASISSFENQSGALESNKRAANWVNTMKQLLPNPPEVIAGDIVLHKSQ